jgi:hypothetical protein
MKLYLHLRPLTKINQNGSKTSTSDFINCKTPTGKHSLTLLLAMIFLNMTPKAQATKAKIN